MDKKDNEDINMEEEEEEEVIIFVEDENDKRYILEVPKIIKCLDLKLKIQTVLKKDNFDIRYKNKFLRKNKDNEFLQLNEKDIIHLEKIDLNILDTISEMNSTRNTLYDEADIKTIRLSGILYLFLVKYMADEIKDLNSIKPSEILSLFNLLKSNTQIKDSPNGDIQSFILETTGKNLYSISNYINMIVKEKNINEFLNILEENEKKKVIKFWQNLSNYEEKISIFEKKFLLLLKNSYFDYSLISLCLYKLKNKKQYYDNLFSCLNPDTKYLFHRTKIDPSKMIFGELANSKNPYGINGISFSDSIDYISFNNNESNGNGNNQKINYGKTPDINYAFSFIVSEIHYDKKNKKEISYPNNDCKEKETTNKSNKLKSSQYLDQNEEKNEIHIIKVEPEDNNPKQNKQSEKNAKKEKKEKQGKFIGTEYILNNMSQILPLFGFTLKRNEYLIIWKDSNLNENNNYNSFLNNLKTLYLLQFSDKNIYFEACTEKALELIKRKRFNKIILISNIGLDFSGKKFVEIARKILGFNIVVLFFSNNNNHLKWIKDFPNSLYTNRIDFCTKYISNYNKDGLINLKKEVEAHYKIKLKLDDKFLGFPKFIKEKKYNDIIFDEICPNFRKVLIKNKDNNNSFLYMDKNRNVSFSFNDGKEIKYLIWYITFIDKEITLYSNESYLSYNKKEKNIIGEKYMVRWNCEQIKNNNFMIYFEKKDYILTKDGDKAIVRKKNKNNLNQIFELFDL